jgi:hypothetical protein
VARALTKPQSSPVGRRSIDIKLTGASMPTLCPISGPGRNRFQHPKSDDQPRFRVEASKAGPRVLYQRPDGADGGRFAAPTLDQQDGAGMNTNGK